MKKWIYAIFVFCNSIHAFGSPMTDNKELLQDFFSYLSFLGSAQNKIDQDSLLRYMDESCLIESNGEVLCKGAREFIAYISRMQQKYERVSYIHSIDESIVSEEKIAVWFQVDCLERTGAQRSLDATAIITIRNGKICNWHEVFQEKSTKSGA